MQRFRLTLALGVCVCLLGCVPLSPALQPTPSASEAPPEQTIEPVSEAPERSMAAATRINTHVEIIAPSPLASATAAPEKPVESESPTGSASPDPAPSSSPTPTPSPTPMPSPTPTPSASPTQFVSSSSGSSGSSSVSATPTPVPTDPPVTVSQVEIEAPAVTALSKGQQLTLSARVHYSDHATSQAVDWQVEPAALASINSEGLLTALSVGTITVRAQSSEDSSQQATLQLQISNPVVRFGGKLVYVANNDLYLMQDDNSNPLQLTNTGATQTKLFPRLAWDGQRLVYTTPDNAIWMLALTPGATPVDQQLAANQTNPVPFILYEGPLLFQGFGGSYGPTHEAWISIPAGPVVPIALADPQNDLNNIGQIGFFGGIDWQGLLFFEQGGQIKRALYTDASTLTDLGPGQHPKIPLTIFANQFVFDQAGKIMRSPFMGTPLALTPGTPFIDQQPAISPSQEKIIFVSNREGNQDLFIMNADGSNIINLTNTPDIDESMPDWSL